MNELEKMIPDFTNQEYLTTERPYKWLDGFKNEPFVFRQKMELIKQDASTKGVKAFMKLWEGYCLQQNRQTKEDIDVTNFTDQPFPLATGGKYICNDEGIKTIRFGLQLIVCLHPIMPVKRLINIDTNEEKLEIAFRKGGKWRSLIVNKADIASSTQILQLAAYGIVVTNDNAKLLSNYLFEMEQFNPGDQTKQDEGFCIPEQKSVSRLGWTDQRSFSPYVDDLIFDGENTFKHIFETVKSNGDRDAWIFAMKQLREQNGAGRLFLAASFASVLIEQCELLPFFLHAWGSTETGKTVGLMIAASVWASPKVGEYIATFNSTAVGQELFADFLNSLPLCLDELQIQSSAGIKDFDRIVYQLTEGVGRTRGAKTGGLQKQSRWRNCIISSGEHPISSAGSGGGAINRILQVEIEAKIYPDLPDLCRVITQNYGFAGKEFIEHLQRPGNLDEAIRLQQDFYDRLLEGTSTEKQAASASVILAADAIATKLFFQDDYALTIQDMANVMTDRNEVDANRRALQYILDLYAANPDRFNHKSTGELWGTMKDANDRKKLLIVKMIFDRELLNAGFNPSAFLAWASRRELLIVNPGRRTLKARIEDSGNAVNTVCLDYTKAEELLNPGILSDYEEINEQLPF